MSRALPARDLKCRDSLGPDVEGVREKERLGEWSLRSLFSVLTRGELSKGEKVEVERREDEVDDRLVGWREGQEEVCAAKFKSVEV